MVTIARAETAADFEQALELMAEYIAWDVEQTRRMGLDGEEFLAFYYGGTSRGDEALPGPFAPPGGCLLLARESGRTIGCGAFRRLSADTCEMKRLFVRLSFQGRGAGRLLAEALLANAREAGYRRMRLDTTTFMKSAQALYAALGFRPCAPYHEVPRGFAAVTLFMELELDARSPVTPHLR
jgi:GNAT superfamily N-acetyltransferase